jgi:hypothetical protein
VLHGEQWFEYAGQACPRDRLTLHSRVVDVVTKRAGMELLTKHTSVTDPSGALVARLGSVLVIRGES